MPFQKGHKFGYKFPKGYTPWNKGKKLSKETKRKMSLAHIGKIFSEDHRKNISLSQIGHPGYLKKHSLKSRKKMSLSAKGNQNWLGKKHSQGSIQKMREINTGERNPSWKGGRILSHGYWLIQKKEHPFADRHGYIPEARFVVESQIGRYLIDLEEVHHIDRIKTNNLPYNLMAFINHSSHMRFHYNPANVRPEEIIFDGRKLLKEPH